jgi:hypothetical protein
VVDPVFLDDRNEERGGFFQDHQAGALQGERVLVGVGADGAAGGDDADAFGGGVGERTFHAGLDHAEDRDAIDFAELVECVGGGGVAGDDDRLDVLGEEESDILLGEALDGFAAFRAVGDAGGVAEVDDGFPGQELLDGADHGEAADSGVEDAEGAWVHGGKKE